MPADPAPLGGTPAEPRVTADRARTTSSARIEAFSDGVFAIVLTLLVLDLRPPETGRFAEQLLDDWQAYVAYLTAFLTIGSMWVNHHAVFSRVRSSDTTTLLLNLGLLLGASLVPWPTSLIAASVRSGDRGDLAASVVVYAVVTAVVGLSWSLLNGHLARRTALLRDPSAAGWLRRNALVATGTVLLAAIEVGLAGLSSILVLALFFLLPIASLVLNARNGSRTHPTEAG